MTGPLNVESGTDTVTLSSNGLSSDANLNLTTESSVTNPTKIFLLEPEMLPDQIMPVLYILMAEKM